MNADLETDRETYAIIGAAMAVHRELGHGFLEPVYQAAFEFELRERDIPFAREIDIPVHYQNAVLPVSYRADFLCFGQVIVELKALGTLAGREEAQVINHLKATRLERGLLLNFGAPSLQARRLILSINNLRKSAQSADENGGTA